jgi:3-hydroxyisobutyrate dehydrogenase-like beta-hydroxyacid dehydrogenase
MENALAVIVRDFRESGLNGELPEVLHALFERANRAGLGQEDTAALIKALRARPGIP